MKSSDIFVDPLYGIGFKRITDAELTHTGNQTHIGLSSKSFPFLEDHDVSTAAFFFYKDNSPLYLKMIIDRIEEKHSGKYRSPKIRVGDEFELENGEFSIDGKIRKISSEHNYNDSWYLVWYVLASFNEEIVFWLLDEADYGKLFEELGIEFKKRAKIIFEQNKKFDSFSNYIKTNHQKIFSDYILRVQELTKTQLYPDESRNRKNHLSIYSDRNSIKVKNIENFHEIGKKGEQLVVDYLEKAGYKKVIWKNEKKESYEPYDISYVDDNNNQVFIEVKSTTICFDQKIIFSEHELDFLLKHKNTKNFYIYRVYDLTDVDGVLSASIRIANELADKPADIKSKKLGFTSIDDIHEIARNCDLDLRRNNSSLKEIKMAIIPSWAFKFKKEGIKHTLVIKKDNES
ncbi:DUF3883 domain-containing protein [Succinivibrio dextrinosolvens]|uniref:DUF3883 domain-containing protein n=1 Tax=Succinivibrio dextrinosolvens TaxID=83771 RepID=UPI00241EE60D|nr:DUF3883 domain-containing protein [Succinivibrio dextrinosolvens]MBE6422835.1 DUF3883 domain-containing protein [Succinivibrio dextrinosolvens]